MATLLLSGRSGSLRVLVMVLAGGEGRRLGPMTLDRAKLAVPFGGRFRIIDIVLSNFVNSGLFKIKILTQYKSASLEEHVARTWRLSPMLDNFIETMDEWTALRGKLLGMAYGEGFRQYKMHPYPTTGLLQELLGESLVKHLEH